VAGEGGTVIIDDFESQCPTTHYYNEYVPHINAVDYNNVLGEGHGTGVLTNYTYTINTWSDSHQWRISILKLQCFHYSLVVFSQ